MGKMGRLGFHEYRHQAVGVVVSALLNVQLFTRRRAIDYPQGIQVA